MDSHGQEHEGLALDASAVRQWPTAAPKFTKFLRHAIHMSLLRDKYELQTLNRSQGRAQNQI